MIRRSAVNFNDINDPSTEKSCATKVTSASLQTAVMHFNSQPRSQGKNRGNEVLHFRIVLFTLDRIEFSAVKLRLLSQGKFTGIIPQKLLVFVWEVVTLGRYK